MKLDQSVLSARLGAMMCILYVDRCSCPFFLCHGKEDYLSNSSFEITSIPGESWMLLNPSFLINLSNLILGVFSKPNIYEAPTKFARVKVWASSLGLQYVDHPS